MGVNRMSNWISVDDKLPQKDKSVFACYRLADGRKRYGIAHYCNGYFDREDVWILQKTFILVGLL